MSWRTDRPRTLSVGDFNSPRGGAKPPRLHQYPLRADHEANLKAKGKGQKCSSPPIFEFPFSIFEFLFSLFGFPRASYLLEMKIQPIISFGIKEGKFRWGTF
jgi:hypothetical protein